MNRDFSIFVPVYNGGAYLKICVESILKQTYPNLKLVILESCSNDGSFEWLKTIKDTRLEICQSSGRLTIEENWNRILSHSKREYMTIVGQDDVLCFDFLEIMNQLIEEWPQASLYLTHFDIIDGKGTRSSFCKPMPKIEYAHEFLAQRFSNLRDSFGTGYVMRAKDYEEAGGIPLYHHLLFADDALWYLLMKKSFKVTSPRVCFSFRRHGENTSAKLQPGDLLRSFQNYKILIKTELENELFRRVFQMYFLEYLNLWLGIEVEFSRKLPSEKFELVFEEIHAIYSEFSLKCPFKIKAEGKFFQKRIVSILRFCLPGGVFEMLKMILEPQENP